MQTSTSPFPRSPSSTADQQPFTRRPPVAQQTDWPSGGASAPRPATLAQRRSRPRYLKLSKRVGYPWTRSSVRARRAATRRPDARRFEERCHERHHCLSPPTSPRCPSASWPRCPPRRRPRSTRTSTQKSAAEGCAPSSTPRSIRLRRTGRTARDSGRDFGTAHHRATARCTSSSNCPRRSVGIRRSWATSPPTIVASATKVEGLHRREAGGFESRFTNWPPTLQQEFAAARRRAGKPSFTLSSIRSTDHAHQPHRFAAQTAPSIFGDPFRTSITATPTAIGRRRARCRHGGRTGLSPSRPPTQNRWRSESPPQRAGRPQPRCASVPRVPTTSPTSRGRADHGAIIPFSSMRTPFASGR